MYTIVKRRAVQNSTVVESDRGNEVDLRIEGGPASRTNDLQALIPDGSIQPPETKAMICASTLPRRGRKVNSHSATAFIFSPLRQCFFYSIGGGL